MDYDCSLVVIFFKLCFSSLTKCRFSEHIDDESSEFVLTTDVPDLKRQQESIDEQQSIEDDHIESIDVDASSTIKKRKYVAVDNDDDGIEVIDDDEQPKRTRLS